MFQVPYYQKDSNFLDNCPVGLPLAPMKRVYLQRGVYCPFWKAIWQQLVRLTYVPHILAVPLLGFHPVVISEAPVHKDRRATTFIQHYLGTPRAGKELPGLGNG